jgi:hypothetical protein
MALAKGGGEGEDVCGGRARIEAADIRFLNNRAIGHWVGERHPKFNHIRPARDERVEIKGGVAIASGDEGDEGWVWFGEGGGEAGHLPENFRSETMKNVTSKLPKSANMTILEKLSDGIFDIDNDKL